MKFLIVIVVVLGVAAIAQAIRVHELAKKLSDKREEDVDLADNNMNANLWILSLLALLGSFFYLIFEYKDAMLPEAASLHGVEIDQLMDFNLWMICTVFVVMNIILMVFAWKYRYDLNKKAFYYPHNDKLELIWTVIPALTMAIIIIYGLNVWNNTMFNDEVAEKDVIKLLVSSFLLHFRGSNGRSHPKTCSHSRHCIHLCSKMRHKCGVDDISRIHSKNHLPIDRNVKHPFVNYDVIFSIKIFNILSIESEYSYFMALQSFKILECFLFSSVRKNFIGQCILQ